ncbi:glyoxalase [Streptomyces sp. NPDC001389]|uniref:glyoxalase n=1 Tax=unclassified Streptomyces TaxID=2593676 RepID=UPI0036C6CB54
MSVRRVVPDVRSESVRESREFYGLLGFEEVMNHGWIMTLASPSSPTSQISFMAEDRNAPVIPDMSVEVRRRSLVAPAPREGMPRRCPLLDEESRTCLPDDASRGTERAN